MLGNGGGRDGVPVLLLWDPHFHPGPLEINTRKIKNSQVPSFPFKSSSDTLIYPACAGKWARFSSPLHTPSYSVYFLLHAPSFLWLIQLLALTLLPVSRQQWEWKNNWAWRWWLCYPSSHRTPAGGRQSEGLLHASSRLRSFDSCQFWVILVGPFKPVLRAPTFIKNKSSGYLTA